MVGPEGTKRISKIDTYLNVAEAFAYRSTCIKRKYGAVIVKDDVVIVAKGVAVLFASLHLPKDKKILIIT